MVLDKLRKMLISMHRGKNKWRGRLPLERMLYRISVGVLGSAEKDKVLCLRHPLPIASWC